MTQLIIALILGAGLSGVLQRQYWQRPCKRTVQHDDVQSAHGAAEHLHSVHRLGMHTKCI